MPQCLAELLGDPVLAGVTAPHAAFNSEHDRPIGHVGMYKSLGLSRCELAGFLEHAWDRLCQLGPSRKCWMLWGI